MGNDTVYEGSKGKIIKDTVDHPPDSFAHLFSKQVCALKLEPVELVDLLRQDWSRMGFR